MGSKDEAPLNLAPTNARIDRLRAIAADIQAITDQMNFAADNLRVVSQSYGEAIGEGNIPGHTKWKVTGYRTEVPAMESHLALAGNGRFVWPTAAQTFWIDSTDADDDGAPVGNGARTWQFQGIKADGTVGTETITLDGVTRVVTAGTYWCPVIDGCKTLTAGTTGYNEGTIQCWDAAVAGNLMWAAPIRANKACGSVYMVPSDRTAFLYRISASESSNQGVTFRLYEKTPTDNVLVLREVWLARNSTILDQFPIPLVYPAGTRIEFTAEANAATATCSMSFLGWEETL